MKIRDLVAKVVCIVLIVSMSLSIVACGKHKVDFTETKQTNSSELKSEASELGILETEGTVVETIDYSKMEPVEVTMMRLEISEQSIDEYVAQLQEQNPDQEYSVYNDEYYTVKMSYADYMEGLENIENKDNIDEMLTTLFTDESFAGAFISGEYNDDLTELTLYVDRAVFEENVFMCSLGCALISMMLMDMYQAYHMVAPEDRVYDIKLIDNATGEEIEVS